MEEQVRPVEMSGAAVNALVERMLPVISGQPVALFSAAALTVMLCSLRPEITDDDLVMGLKDISAYITCWVSALDATTRVQAGEPAGMLN